MLYRRVIIVRPSQLFFLNSFSWTGFFPCSLTQWLFALTLSPVLFLCIHSQGPLPCAPSKGFWLSASSQALFSCALTQLLSRALFRRILFHELFRRAFVHNCDESSFMRPSIRHYPCTPLRDILHALSERFLQLVLCRGLFPCAVMQEFLVLLFRIGFYRRMQLRGHVMSCFANPSPYASSQRFFLRFLFWAFFVYCSRGGSLNLLPLQLLWCFSKDFFHWLFRRRFLRGLISQRFIAPAILPSLFPLPFLRVLLLRALFPGFFPCAPRRGFLPCAL